MSQAGVTHKQSLAADGIDQGNTGKMLKYGKQDLTWGTHRTILFCKSLPVSAPPNAVDSEAPKHQPHHFRSLTLPVKVSPHSDCWEEASFWMNLRR